MTYKITVIFFLILSCLLFPVYGFTFNTPPANFSHWQDSSAPPVQTKMQQIIVYTLDQAPVSGFMVGIKSDTLIILSSGQTVKVSRSDLSKVIILKENKDKIGLKLGMIMGLYVGNLLLFKAEDQSTVYLATDPIEYFLLCNMGFLGLGGLIGHLFDPGLSEEVVLDFTENEQLDLQSWKKIENTFYSDSPRHKIHFSVYSSHLHDLATAQHKSFFKDYLHISNFRDYGMGVPDEIINLWRRIQITYDLRPDLEVGSTLAFLGEPFFRGYSYSRSPYVSLVEQLRNTGYYLSFFYYPFQSGRNINKIYWNVGLSLGIADIDYVLKTEIYSTPLPPIKISKHPISLLVSSELYFSRTGTVAFGLQADYAFIPQQRIGGIPEIGLPAKKLNFSNGGIGILFKINL
jgi:hypothetical protein